MKYTTDHEAFASLTASLIELSRDGGAVDSDDVSKWLIGADIFEPRVIQSLPCEDGEDCACMDAANSLAIGEDVCLRITERGRRADRIAAHNNAENTHGSAAAIDRVIEWAGHQIGALRDAHTLPDGTIKPAAIRQEVEEVEANIAEAKRTRPGEQRAEAARDSNRRQLHDAWEQLERRRMRERQLYDALWVLDGHARLYMTLAPNVDEQVREALSGGPAISDAVVRVMSELARARKKFPLWPDDPIHAVCVVQEEAGELSQAVLQSLYEPHKSDLAHVDQEATQLAAMAIRFLENIKKYRTPNLDQHDDGEAAPTKGGTE